MPGGAAPPIRNRSYIIQAEVRIPPEGAEGVLIAHGGRFAGYALYIKDNRLVYDHNYLGIEHYRVISEKGVPAGPSVLAYQFEKTGEHQGTGRLFINGTQVGEAGIPRTVPVHFGPEGLDIGRDTLTPVSEEYSCPFAFTGVLKKVAVTVNGELHLDPEGDFKAAMVEQ